MAEGVNVFNVEHTSDCPQRAICGTLMLVWWIKQFNKLLAVKNLLEKIIILLLVDKLFNFYIRHVHLDIIKVFLFTNECTNDYLKNNIKIYVKIAPNCFGAVTPSSGSYFRTVQHTHTHQQGHYQYVQPHHRRFSHTPMYHIEYFNNLASTDNEPAWRLCDYTEICRS